ncbi:MAG: hypothetical protein EXS58_04500 [Candidatus Latescibacteria bacterium]|nr:hypothetical protein [Candidatus Latescibacterota bacterium]
MKRRGSNWVVIVTLSCMVPSGGASALEVFRIGGASEPPPNQPGVNFHQLQWSDFAEKEGLDEEVFAMGVLQPLFLAPEENIALASVDRGGGPYTDDYTGGGFAVTEASKAMLDADPSTFYEWEVPPLSLDPLSGQAYAGHLPKLLITVDLGRVFQVNRVRLFTSDSGHYPDKLDIATNTGVMPGAKFYLTPDEVVFKLAENVQDTIDVHFPPSLARNVELMLYRASPKTVTVAEVEIYGEGYINRASYASQLIDLGEPAIWGDIHWHGHQDSQAKVWIQSRAGKDLDPAVYWRFTGRADEVSPLDAKGNSLKEATYAQLKPGEAAQITYDTENWSFWSPPYEFAASNGTPVLSPGPNSVFQLRVDFLPTVGDGGAVDFIEFSATKPPLVEKVVGEIYPPQVPLGETAQFTYAIRPTIQPQHAGFDRIEISTPFGLAGVDTVKIGGVPAEAQVGIERPDSTLFSVQLPHHRQATDSGELIEVVFRAPVLRYGTVFDGWVRDTDRPLEVAQRINPGNATDQLVSEVLAVRTSASSRLLTDLRVDSRTFTPNGDGVNEAVNFFFELLQLTDEAPLKLEIFDLSGRQVRVVYEGRQQSGRFHFSWDGRNTDLELVPPGLYIYHLAVEAGGGRDQQVGTVAVAY